MTFSRDNVPPSALAPVQRADLNPDKAAIGLPIAVPTLFGAILALSEGRRGGPVLC